LWVDYLIEIKPTGSSGGKIVWQWNLWDHLVQDYDPKKSNYGGVSEHPGRIDINAIETPVPITGSRMRLLQSVGYVGGQKAPSSALPPIPDWTHVNAVAYDPQLDQIMLTTRTMGEVWIIDHSTSTSQAATESGGKLGKGGGLLYRWGNPQAYQCGKPSDQKLFGPHNGHWIPRDLPGGGNVLIFNNGDGRRDGEYSTIEEIKPPVSADGSYPIKAGAAYGPEASVWTYVSEPKTSFFSSFLSGAQRLPNGNTLICAGVQAEVFEVDQSGRTLWRYKAEKKDEPLAQPAGSPSSPPPLGNGPSSPPPTGGRASNPMPFPMPPLITTLDADDDGAIDADEIAQAAASLKKLDMNKDGRIAIEECLPMPGGGPGGFPGPGGPGGPGGPPGFPGLGGPGGPPPLPPIFIALDSNSDRAIDSEETQQAPDRLTKLDGNKDGKISRDESLPQFPGGPGFPQGPGGGPPGFPGDAGPGPGGKPPLPPIITALTSDRDGTIGADEIVRAPELLKQLDRDGDGSLALTECLPPMPGGPNGFPPGASPNDRQSPPQNLPPIITALDSNRDMKIDAQEIAAATGALQKLDRNGDGRISSDESLPGPLGAPPMPGAPNANRVPGTFASGGLFRAVRFGLDYPAFKGRTLTPLPER
jgi:hypothetical protein